MRPNGHFDVEAVKRHVDIERLLKKYDVQLKRTGADSLTGKCPFHQDKSPSLSVTPSKGRWHCFGCGAAGDGIALVQRKENLDFPAALKRTAEFVGMSSLPAVETATPQGATAKPKVNGQATSGAKTQSSRIVETYPYTDEKGELLYEVLRFEPKSFRQRRPDGNGGWTWSLGDVRRVLYRLPAVLKSEKVFVAEGEKDVHTLEASGLVATTNSSGANQPWLPAYTEALTGKTVIVIPDSTQTNLVGSVGTGSSRSLQARLKGCCSSSCRPDEGHHRVLRGGIRN